MRKGLTVAVKVLSPATVGVSPPVVELGAAIEVLVPTTVGVVPVVEGLSPAAVGLEAVADRLKSTTVGLDAAIVGLSLATTSAVTHSIKFASSYCDLSSFSLDIISLLLEALVGY